MAVKYTRPRGTQDVLPGQSGRWLRLEKLMRRTVGLYGYKEIRLPTFEATEVFARGVGDTTDIVSKEMYTFLDKGNRSITLRPEGTAGVARAILENGLLGSSPAPLKAYYLQSCFRYEKAQKGRLREFHQLGIECYGADDPAADAEVIAVARQILSAAGLRQVRLEINSIGCPTAVPSITRPCENISAPTRPSSAKPAWSVSTATPCAFWTARWKAAARWLPVRRWCWTTCVRTARAVLIRSRRCWTPRASSTW